MRLVSKADQEMERLREENEEKLRKAHEEKPREAALLVEEAGQDRLRDKDKKLREAAFLPGTAGRSFRGPLAVSGVLSGLTSLHAPYSFRPRADEHGWVARGTAYDMTWLAQNLGTVCSAAPLSSDSPAP